MHDYEWRSKVVHGSRIAGRDDEEARAVILRTEETVRAALNRILVNSEMTEILNGTDRDSYLSRLALEGKEG